jgi:hypothetical protein
VIAVTAVVIFVLIVFFVVVVVVAVMVVVVVVNTINHANKELSSIPHTETFGTCVRRTNLLESKVRIWAWVEVIRHRRWVEGECRLLGRERLFGVER